LGDRNRYIIYLQNSPVNTSAINIKAIYKIRIVIPAKQKFRQFFLIPSEPVNCGNTNGFD
jgi:hypothetical protein